MRACAALRAAQARFAGSDPEPPTGFAEHGFEATGEGVVLGAVGAIMGPWPTTTPPGSHPTSSPPGSA